MKYHGQRDGQSERNKRVRNRKSRTTGKRDREHRDRGIGTEKQG